MSASLDYLAGVLDVAGSLMVVTRGKQGLTALIMLQNERSGVLDQFAARFGGKVVHFKVGERDRFTWQKRGTAARTVLLAMRPYLKVRMADVDRLLRVEGWA